MITGLGPWGSVAWSVILYTESQSRHIPKLQVCSPVGTSKGGNGSKFLSHINVFLSLSHSLSPRKVHKKHTFILILSEDVFILLSYMIDNFEITIHEVRAHMVPRLWVWLHMGGNQSFFSHIDFFFSPFP